MVETRLVTIKTVRSDWILITFRELEGAFVKEPEIGHGRKEAS